MDVQVLDGAVLHAKRKGLNAPSAPPMQEDVSSYHLPALNGKLVVGRMTDFLPRFHWRCKAASST